MLSALGLAAVLSGCIDDDANRPADGAQDAVAVTSVRIQDNNFDPEAIAVAPGAIVTWEWQGDSQHNVVGDDFSSPVQNSGAFEHRFDEPGTYQYRCTLHAGMDGMVVVTARAAAGAMTSGRWPDSVPTA